MNGLGVIFDMDGVLVDSYDAHFQSWRKTAHEYGLNLTEQDFARTFGRTSREIIQHLWPSRFSNREVLEFDARKEAAYREILQLHLPAMDGVAELLADLHATGFALAIGSSGPAENVKLVRRRLPNGNLISAAVNGSEVTAGKPDPQVFLLAAQKLKLRPEDCAVVEDAPVGVEAAHHAGMTAIGLVGTTNRAGLQQHSHLIVDSLQELNSQVIQELILARRLPT